MARSTISVALCTYNGERFLAEQLASIASQTRLPDELVCCDDKSTDGTVAMLESFAASVSFPVRIVRNARNLGSNENFAQAIFICKGDLIALCDQDDRWLPRRLEVEEQALDAHAGMQLVFANAAMLTETGERLASRLWDQFQFSAQSKEQLGQGDYLPLLRYRFVTGATVMFRARYRDWLFPVGKGWVHDGWIAALLACAGGVLALDEPLIEYRRHAAQQVGTGPAGNKQKTFAKLVRDHWGSIDWHHAAVREVADRLEKAPPLLRDSTVALDFVRHEEFLAMRLNLPRSRFARVAHVAPYLAEYGRRASGARSIVLDMLLPKRTSEMGASRDESFSIFGG